MAGVPGLMPGSGGRKKKNSPGPGAPTGGTGQDADGGKERSEFEKQRQKDRGTGKDRPPVYKPTPRTDTIKAAGFGSARDKAQLAAANANEASRSTKVNPNGSVSTTVKAAGFGSAKDKRQLAAANKNELVIDKRSVKQKLKDASSRR